GHRPEGRRGLRRGHLVRDAGGTGNHVHRPPPAPPLRRRRGLSAGRRCTFCTPVRVARERRDSYYGRGPSTCPRRYAHCFRRAPPRARHARPRAGPRPRHHLGLAVLPAPGRQRLAVRRSGRGALWRLLVHAVPFPCRGRGGLRHARRRPALLRDREDEGADVPEPSPPETFRYAIRFDTLGAVVVFTDGSPINGGCRLDEAFPADPEVGREIECSEAAPGAMVSGGYDQEVIVGGDTVTTALKAYTYFSGLVEETRYAADIGLIR